MAERLRGRAGVRQRLRLARTNHQSEDCTAEGTQRLAIIIVIDHLIPLAHGGSDEDSNTRNLYDDHNRKKIAEQFGLKQAPAVALEG